MEWYEHPAFIFATCFIVFFAVPIIVAFCSWKHELCPAFNDLLHRICGISQPGSGIEQAAVSALQTAVSALQTASGAAVQVHFISDRSDVQLGGQMGQAGGQINQPEGKMVSGNEAVRNWRNLAPSVLDTYYVIYPM